MQFREAGLRARFVVNAARLGRSSTPPQGRRRSLPTHGDVTALTASAAHEAGFTLIEVLVAVAGARRRRPERLIALLDTRQRRHDPHARPRQRDQPRARADRGRAQRPLRAGLEPRRRSPSCRTCPASTTIDGGAYTIRRGAITYTVAIDVCIMDDPKDGGGPRAAAAPRSAPNSAPARHRRTGTPRTTSGSRSPSRGRTGRARAGRRRPRSSTTRAAPAGRPSARSRRAATARRTRCSTDLNAVTFDAHDVVQAGHARAGCSTAPARRAPITPNGSTGPRVAVRLADQDRCDDGAYVIGAEAYDVYGVVRARPAGDRRAQPLQPARAQAGRPAAAPSSAPSRSSGPPTPSATSSATRSSASAAASPVCPVATQELKTFCTDESPPHDAPLEYYVRAYDRDPSGQPARGRRLRPASSSSTRTTPPRTRSRTSRRPSSPTATPS